VYNEALNRSFNFPMGNRCREGDEIVFRGDKGSRAAKTLSSVAERGSRSSKIEYMALIFVILKCAGLQQTL